MKWDQIEDRWTKMTRGIRADWRAGPESLGGPRRASVPTPLTAAASDGNPTDTKTEYANPPTHS
jgi:hypothetical protein